MKNAEKVPIFQHNNVSRPVHKITFGDSGTDIRLKSSDFKPESAISDCCPKKSDLLNVNPLNGPRKLICTKSGFRVGNNRRLSSVPARNDSVPVPGL